VLSNPESLYFYLLNVQVLKGWKYYPDSIGWKNNGWKKREYENENKKFRVFHGSSECHLIACENVRRLPDFSKIHGLVIISGDSLIPNGAQKLSPPKSRR
jgi:hypothetical protein